MLSQLAVLIKWAVLLPVLLLDVSRIAPLARTMENSFPGVGRTMASTSAKLEAMAKSKRAKGDDGGYQDADAVDAVDNMS